MCISGICRNLWSLGPIYNHRGNILFMLLGLLTGTTQLALRLLMARERSRTLEGEDASPRSWANRVLILMSLFSVANVALVPVFLFGFPEAGRYILKNIFVLQYKSATQFQRQHQPWPGIHLHPGSRTLHIF